MYLTRMIYHTILSIVFTLFTIVGCQHIPTAEKRYEPKKLIPGASAIKKKIDAGESVHVFVRISEYDFRKNRKLAPEDVAKARDILKEKMQSVGARSIEEEKGTPFIKMILTEQAQLEELLAQSTVASLAYAGIWGGASELHATGLGPEHCDVLQPEQIDCSFRLFYNSCEACSSTGRQYEWNDWGFTENPNEPLEKCDPDYYCDNSHEIQRLDFVPVDDNYDLKWTRRPIHFSDVEKYKVKITLKSPAKFDFPLVVRIDPVGGFIAHFFKGSRIPKNIEYRRAALGEVVPGSVDLGVTSANDVFWLGCTKKGHIKGNGYKSGNAVGGIPIFLKTTVHDHPIKEEFVGPSHIIRCVSDVDLHIDWWHEKDFTGTHHRRELFPVDIGKCLKIEPNDAMKSIKFFALPGWRLQIFDNSDCKMNDDWGEITFPSQGNIISVDLPKIGSRGPDEVLPPGSYEFHYKNGLPGKVSAIRYYDADHAGGDICYGNYAKIQTLDFSGNYDITTPSNPLTYADVEHYTVNIRLDRDAPCNFSRTFEIKEDRLVGDHKLGELSAKFTKGSRTPSISYDRQCCEATAYPPGAPSTLTDGTFWIGCTKRGKTKANGVKGDDGHAKIRLEKVTIDAADGIGVAGLKNSPWRNVTCD